MPMPPRPISRKMRKSPRRSSVWALSGSKAPEVTLPVRSPISPFKSSNIFEDFPYLFECANVLNGCSALVDAHYQGHLLVAEFLEVAQGQDFTIDGGHAV